MEMDWDESLATGYPEIDEQHRELFRRFGNLRTACTGGKGQKELHGLYLFLADYVKSHFALEEALQVRYEYAGYREHKGEHDHFIERLKKLEDHLHSTGPTATLVIETHMTLVSYLIRHIGRFDRDLADFLALENLSIAPDAPPPWA